MVDRGVALAHERGNRAWERDLRSQSVQPGFVLGHWDRAVETVRSLELSGVDDSYRVADSILPLILAPRGDTAALDGFLAIERPPSEWRSSRSSISSRPPGDGTSTGSRPG